MRVCFSAACEVLFAVIKGFIKMIVPQRPTVLSEAMRNSALLEHTFLPSNVDLGAKRMLALRQSKRKFNRDPMTLARKALQQPESWEGAAEDTDMDVLLLLMCFTISAN